MDTQRLILFIAFSFSLLLLWDAWQKQHEPPPAKEVVSHSTSADQPPKPTESLSGRPVGAQPGGESVLSHGQSVTVHTDLFNAVIDTDGGDIRHLAFTKQRESTDKSKNFVLFTGDQGQLYVPQSGFIGGNLPTHKAQYTITDTNFSLLPGKDTLTVTLHWSDNGMEVDKVYTFHRNSYVIDVSYTVHNGGAQALAPDAYFQFLRTDHAPAGDPKFIHTYTGPAYFTDQGKFHKISFSDIEKGKAELPGKTDNGWIAMLQHYFLAAWLPEGHIQREFFTRSLGSGLFSTGVILPMGELAPGTARTLTVRLYAGPQEQDKLAKLAPGLDLTVDYGWLTVIATPMFWALSTIHKFVGNWGVAIILLTVLLKLLFFPLSAKSYRSMAHMRALAPKLQKLKEQYGEDRQRLHQAMMELYKTEKINPLGGCLPVVVQIPFFIGFYWVLLSTFELRQAPFMLWIHDLSVPDPYYVLPVIMGITMLVQTRLNPTPPDPIQAKVMMMMPIVFSVFFFFFPAGLVLYWLVNNILSIGQQWYITRSTERAKAEHAKKH